MPHVVGTHFNDQIIQVRVTLVHDSECNEYMGHRPAGFQKKNVHFWNGCRIKICMIPGEMIYMDGQLMDSSFV